MLTPPTLMIIGDVVRLRERLDGSAPASRAAAGEPGAMPA